MKFKSLIVAAAFAALAVPANAAGNPDMAAPGRALPSTLLPFFGTTEEAPIVQLAQAADPRVQQLEEQVRALTGKVEELNFQLLQLQDQMRKMQEDNDLRFQELEKQGNAGNAGGDQQEQTAEAKPEETKPAEDQQATAEQPAAPDDQTATAGEPASQDQVEDNQTAAEQPAPSDQQTAANDGGAASQPQDLGSIKLDSEGNVVEGGIDIKPGANSAGPANEVVAAIQETKDPKVLYSTAYELILAGDYANAEAAFGAHAEKFPDDAKAPDVRYWLGEAQLGQGKFQQAAETFLNASKSYPDAPKAPDTLLKLGVALAGMNNRDLACQTFTQVSERYPNMKPALAKRLAAERTQASC